MDKPVDPSPFDFRVRIRPTASQRELEQIEQSILRVQMEHGFEEYALHQQEEGDFLCIHVIPMVPRKGGLTEPELCSLRQRCRERLGEYSQEMGKKTRSFLGVDNPVAPPGSESKSEGKTISLLALRAKKE